MTKPSDNFEKAVARACMREAGRYTALDPFRAGDESAVLHGAMLSQIAAEAGLSVPQARRRLKRLHDAGKTMRTDTTGGCTRWWLRGLAPAPAAAAPAQAKAEPSAPRQTLTAPPATHRGHWSDVLGVARDCSTSEARAAFKAATAALDADDPDYSHQLQRVREAIDACCREHEIQIEG